MGPFLARRALYSVFVVWGAVTVIFLLVRVIPGDPAALIGGPTATPEQIEAIARELGTREPLPIQYLRFLQGAIMLDFGDSFRIGGSAISQVFQKLPATAILSFTAMLIAVVVSAPLGILAARHPGTFIDRVVSRFSLIGQSLPNFWVGLMLILLFSRQLRLLPSAGAESWQGIILPAVSLALPLMSVLIRLVRGGLLEVLGEDYVRTARAKGLNENVVVYHHAVRNMLIPVVTVAGLQLGRLLGGTVVVETVFAWPGIGRLLVDSIFARDFPVVQAAVAVIAVVFVFINLAVDLLYGRLDPRARVGGS